MTDNNKEVSVTSAEQINYVWITLKELTCIMWETIRERRLWTVSNKYVENFDDYVEEIKW